MNGTFWSGARRVLGRLIFGLDPIVLMLPVAAGVGFVTAVAVEGFRGAMELLIGLYSTHEHLVAAATDLPPLKRVLVPLLAATTGGLIMWAGQRWVQRGHGPEYMEAIRVGDGRLPLAPNLVRTASSLPAISGGITIGREGTMIQFAAVISSLIGRIGRLAAPQQRLIVACGSAAGFAAAYHAPIAGALFVAEIILRGLPLREIAAVLVAAVIGELTTESLFDSGPLYLVQSIPAVRFGDLVDISLLGLLAGFAGPAFLWLLDASRRRYQAWIGFAPVRMGLVGLLIGLLSLLRPEVWGNGYSTVQSLLVQPWTLNAVAAVFALRLIAVTAASAAGIPGGVLTPTLSLGGAIGLIAAQLVELAYPALGAAPGVELSMLAGMGSLLAAITHAPAMSAILVFEMTRNYNVVIASMPACVIASVVSHLIHHRSVYSEALGLKEENAPGSFGPGG
jgi:CIC family chloride channel protein